MKDFTSINILLDRSGSMGVCREETLNGLNVFIEDQQKEGDNADLTLVQFDSGGIDSIYSATPIKDVKKLELKDYVPRGYTPLLDALGKTIVNVGERFSSMKEEDRPDKVVFVVITDGEENASHEYKRETIKKLIEQQQSIYNWQFVYLGANQDSFTEAGSIGFSAQNVSNYGYATTDQMMAATTQNIRNYRVSSNTQSLAYSDDQRKAMA